jgi:Flp pilus assembly protein TadG
MRPWKPSTDRAGDAERGSASLEFLTAGLILLIPLVYLIVAMSAIQGAALAVEGAARQAARVYVQAPDQAEAGARSTRAVQFGLADYGIDAEDASVSVDCENSGACLSRLSTVTVTVRVSVLLPLVPDALSLPEITSIPVQASATQTVSRFWGAG